jgi:hypothetical protein
MTVLTAEVLQLNEFFFSAYVYRGILSRWKQFKS